MLSNGSMWAIGRRGASPCMDLPPGVKLASCLKAADPSGSMGRAMSVTRTSLALFGGTPSASAAIPERSGAGCRR
jgi:hypothetical protein